MKRLLALGLAALIGCSDNNPTPPPASPTPVQREYLSKKYTISNRSTTLPDYQHCTIIEATCSQDNKVSYLTAIVDAWSISIVARGAESWELWDEAGEDAWLRGNDGKVDWFRPVGGYKPVCRKMADSASQQEAQAAYGKYCSLLDSRRKLGQQSRQKSQDMFRHGYGSNRHRSCNQRVNDFTNSR